MASLTKRKGHAHVYYYLVESQRVNGKPRLVKQKYLDRSSPRSRRGLRCL